jgi:hypothetical protein
MNAAVAQTPVAPDDFVPPAVLAAKSAAWLMPLLKEYAEKLAALSRRCVEIREAFFSSPRHSLHAWAAEAGRVVCLHESLYRQSKELATQGVGLLEHAQLDYEARVELRLRVEEFEECYRFSKVMVDELVATIDRAGTAWLPQIRELIVRSGRYKSPV